MQNQDKNSKYIKSLLETHKQEMKEIKDAFRDLGPKFDKLTKVISKVTTNYNQIEQG
jgi:DNA anti-recombination protein RmuC